MVTARRQAGFTAAEILVVIAIVGVLAAIAIPAMSTILANSAVRTASYDLNADLTFARSQAIALGQNVTITGASASTNFKNGWTITDAAGNTLRSQGARTSKITFVSNLAAYTFDRTGRLTAGSSPAKWDIAPTDVDNSYSAPKRCIQLDPSGRPRTFEGVCP